MPKMSDRAWAVHGVPRLASGGTDVAPYHGRRLYLSARCEHPVREPALPAQACEGTDRDGDCKSMSDQNGTTEDDVCPFCGRPWGGDCGDIDNGYDCRMTEYLNEEGASHARAR